MDIETCRENIVLIKNGSSITRGHSMRNLKEEYEMWKEKGIWLSWVPSDWKADSNNDHLKKILLK